MKKLLQLSCVSLLAACAQAPAPQPAKTAEAESARMAHLEKILAMQPDEARARYPYRHPQQTLGFIGIEPGMTVVEALPGRGWYSKILLPYLGEDGHLIGADYDYDMFPLFGFFSDEQLEAKKTWTTTWTEEANGWRGDGSATVSAFVFGSMPEDLAGSADAVLFIRALHNLARFEKDGKFLTAALDETYRVLKPGGIVGVVQHQVRDDVTDEWADGSRGYLKKDFVIARMKQAGFEYLGASPINENPKDRPTGDDIVWRLPPTLFTSREDPELREKMTAIGESNRMTLRFRKPAG